MENKKRTFDGRTSDLAFSWMIVTNGLEWEQWRKIAASWMEKQNTGVADRLRALIFFFDVYLPTKAPYSSNPLAFFSGNGGHKCSSHEFVETMKEHGLKSETDLYRRPTLIKAFIDFALEHEFYDLDDSGERVALYENPFTSVKLDHCSTETVHSPLPYRYIKDLREIIIPSSQLDGASESNFCKGLNFSDLKWAIKNSENLGAVNWVDVDDSVIDESDPDCVWRLKKVNRGGKGFKQIYQIWSPVRAILILLKLHLPLRTYQVRMLDSGEADTWRYEQGQWLLNNKHDFALGTKKRPFGKGVFRRIHDSMTGQYSTGLYINTNKTADLNKDELERGYIIPWQNEEVLYWLEKLRNWQEKYNPISKPVDCSTLSTKHAGIKSKSQLNSMGEMAFLFRDPTAKTDEDKAKPVTSISINGIWHRLLLELEERLYAKGEMLDNGERLSLTDESKTKYGTKYPLHSLRVSLITAYTMETRLPLPVISKLLAGHTRLLMTIYYNKITPSVMAEKMDEAQGALDAKSKQSVRNFLKDASMEQIQCKMVYRKEESVQAALVNRNPIGWEERATGLCLVGGNTVKSDEVSTLGGCWNGGELIKDSKNAAQRLYDSVPHGPENCIRCRWFITEARYLPALNAQFNQLSYKAHQAANLSVEIEGDLEALKDEQFFCEEQGTPFTKHGDLQALQRRYEKQQVEADEYAKDWIACFDLISKIIRVEEARNDGDTKQKLVAVGAGQDVSYAIKFVETDSELLHLSLLCDDAEFYPDLQDELRKTPAIQKRSMQLSRVLMKKGFEPIFLEMDEKQQLIAANAMLRQMAKIADPDDKLEGYRKVANYIEAGEYLEKNKLFNAGMSALTDKALHLENLSQPALLEG